MHKLTPSTGLTSHLKDSYYSHAYFTSQVWINTLLLALHSCSCISTAGMSVPNHTSSQGAAALWTDLPKTEGNKTTEPACTAKPPEAAGATWFKHMATVNQVWHLSVAQTPQTQGTEIPLVPTATAEPLLWAAGLPSPQVFPPHLHCRQNYPFSPTEQGSTFCFFFHFLAVPGSRTHKNPHNLHCKVLQQNSHI